MCVNLHPGFSTLLPDAIVLLCLYRTIPLTDCIRKVTLMGKYFNDMDHK